MARNFSRLDRIGDTLKRELAELIQHHVNDPRVGMVSVTEVKVSKDLAHAKVFVSLMVEEAKIPDAIAALNHAAGYLRYQLAQRVDLRVMPALRFYYDDSAVRGSRIATLIDQALRDKSS